MMVVREGTVVGYGTGLLEDIAGFPDPLTSALDTVAIVGKGVDIVWNIGMDSCDMVVVGEDTEVL